MPVEALRNEQRRDMLLAGVGSSSNMSGRSGDSSSRRLPESLFDRVMRLRVEVTDQFNTVASASAPQDPSALAKAVQVVQAQVLRSIQSLADDLPRALYQESIHASMRKEYEQRAQVLHTQQQQLAAQQQQLYRRMAAGQSANTTGGGTRESTEAGCADDSTSASLCGSPPQSPQRLAPRSRNGGFSGALHMRPASAGLVASNGTAVLQEETFGEAHLRHLYSQLHDAKISLKHERVRVDALKAFCTRKDAAVDYIRETLLQEVVALKEQLRRQDQDPNFVSDFVTLFDCWKVLQGDDPAGAGGGDASEAVKQAKKELQAEAARVQQQYQMALKKKDDEIAELQARFGSAAAVASLEKKKSSKKGKGDEFHEQFLQLTADLAKKDTLIGELSEELKQLQTEVAIAQQLAKSTRDQLNRSNADVEQACSVRDREIQAKTDLIDELEGQIRQLKAAAGDDPRRELVEENARLQAQLASQTDAIARLQDESFTAQRALNDVQQRLELQREELAELQRNSQLSTDEIVSALEIKLTKANEAVAVSDSEKQQLTTQMRRLEIELDSTSSRLETVKFENMKLRTELRSAKPQLIEELERNEATAAAALTAVGTEDCEALLDGEGEGAAATPSADLVDALRVAAPKGRTAKESAPLENADNSSGRSANWGLERRLAKEMEAAKQLRTENDALKAELLAVVHAGALSSLKPTETVVGFPSSSPAEEPLATPSVTRKKGGGRSKSPIANDRSGNDALQRVIDERDVRIRVLERELEAARQATASAAAEALSRDAPATFAYHVGAKGLTSSRNPVGTSPEAASSSFTAPGVAPTMAIESFSTPASAAKSSSAAGGGVAKASSKQKAQEPKGKPTTERPQHGGSQTAPIATVKRSVTSRPTETILAARHTDDDVSAFQDSFHSAELMTPIHVSRGGEVRGDAERGATVSVTSDPSADADDIPAVTFTPAGPRSDTGKTAAQWLPAWSGELPASGFSHQQRPSPAASRTPIHEDDLDNALTPAPSSSRVALLEATLAKRDAQLHQNRLEISALLDEVSKLSDALAAVPNHSNHHDETLRDAHDGQEGRANAFGEPRRESCPSPRKSPRLRIADNGAGGGAGFVECHDAAVQTELLASQLAATAGGGGGQRPPTATSRQGSAHAHHREQAVSGGGVGAVTSRPVSPDKSAVQQHQHPHPDAGTSAAGASGATAGQLVPTQRVFSAHRRAVHSAGSSVSVQQRSGRMDEQSFYMCGDGEVIGMASDADTPVYPISNGLAGGKVLKQRPQGSANSQRSAGPVDKLNYAVAMAKGLSDSTKARAAGAALFSSRPSSAHHELDVTADRSSSHATLQPDTHVLPQYRSSQPSQAGVVAVAKPSSIVVLPGASSAPVVLTGTPDLVVLAREQLTSHRMRMSPSLTPAPTTHPPAGTAPQAQLPADTAAADDGAATDDFVAPVVAASQRPQPNSTAAAQQLPNTVDFRDHYSLVVLGGGGESGAVRGVKEKIKQNINIEKFVGKVLHGKT